MCGSRTASGAGCIVCVVVVQPVGQVVLCVW